MIKKSLIFLILLGVCFAQQKKLQYDFRKTRWGMSMKDIIQAEGKPDTIMTLDAHRKLMIYDNRTIASKKTLIGYILAYNQLVRANYLFKISHSNTNLYMQDYQEIKKLLQAKYGKPKEDEVIWLNDLYKDDPEHWGFAISMGHLRYFASWDLPRTEITLILYGDNFKINLRLEYVSKTLRDLEEKAKKESALEEF